MMDEKLPEKEVFTSLKELPEKEPVLKEPMVNEPPLHEPFAKV